MSIEQKRIRNLELEVERLTQERDAQYDLNVSMVAKHAAQEAEIEKLNREIRYLRHYGNKDCTHMAEQAIANGEMDD